MAMQALALDARTPIATCENPRKKHRVLRCFFLWLCCVADPRSVWRGLAGYVWYLRDWRRYRRLPGAEPLRLIDSRPQVHDRTATSPFDSHYFYLNGWAMRRIVGLKPPSHVDIGSAVTFPCLLGAVLPVCFVDYRPLPARCAGMESVAGDITSLPFARNSVQSLSCLHVAEHIGLGRYGDPLDADGTRKAARELMRILAPGGSLFFGVPVGIARTCFNAHRIHAAHAVREYFGGLELVEFSGVHDDGGFVEHVDLAEFENDVYACGMFWFRKPRGANTRASSVHPRVNASASASDPGRNADLI